MEYVVLSKEQVDQFLDQNMQQPLNILEKNLKNYFPNIRDWGGVDNNIKFLID